MGESSGQTMRPDVSWADYRARELPVQLLPLPTVRGNAIMVRKKKAATTESLAAKPTAATATKPATTSPTAGSGVQRWVPTVAPLAQQYGVPMDVALGIMDIESGGNPKAVSAAGAKGLMQVMPMNFAPGEDGMDPVTNITRGLKMLADRFKRFGSWEKAAASYFGAADSQGNPTTAADVNGQTGVGYVRAFQNARGKYASP